MKTFLFFIAFIIGIISPYKLLIPLYIFPTIDSSQKCSEKNWLKVANEASEGSIVIINPNNGPIDSNSPEFPAWVSCMSLLLSKGIKLIGYVHSKNSYLDTTTNNWVQTGFRDFKDISADIALYKSQYPQVSGIFVDEVSNIWLPAWNQNKDTHLQFYATIYRTIKLTDSNYKVFLNPGGPLFEELLQEGAYKSGENAVIFESGVASWNKRCKDFGIGPFCSFVRKWDGVDGLRESVLAGKYSVSAMIYGISKKNLLSDDINLTVTAKQHNIEYIFFTDGAPWSSLPTQTLWSAQINN